MNKKILGIAFVLGSILILTGAGCINKSPAQNSKQENIYPPAVNQQSPNSTATEPPDDNKDSGDMCNSATEAEVPNGLAKELKSIYSEAGGEIIFSANIGQGDQVGDALMYVVKIKPTTAKLENAFKKHGYKIALSGNIMVVTKDKLALSINLVEGAECQALVMMRIDEPFNLGGTVTTGECQKMLELAQSADVRSHNIFVAMLNAQRLYNYWYMLAAKYGVTKEAITKTCKTKLGL
ncbi:MAG: hypothetical protein WC526_01085 [Patescibacteria group bacterium]